MAVYRVCLIAGLAVIGWSLFTLTEMVHNGVFIRGIIGVETTHKFPVEVSNR